MNCFLSLSLSQNFLKFIKMFLYNRIEGELLSSKTISYILLNMYSALKPPFSSQPHIFNGPTIYIRIRTTLDFIKKY